MRAGVTLRSWLRAGLHRSRMEQDMDNEIHFHIERYTEDLVRDGISPEEARRRALAEFGAVEGHKEECRQAIGLRLLDEVRADLRFACRMLRQSSAFTTVAIFSLALGIGANTAIFSMLNATMLRTLPVEDPHRLVQLQSSGRAFRPGYFSNSIWEQVRDRQQAFSGMLSWSTDRFDLSVGGESHFAEGLWVSGNFFRVLGVPAMRGRLITTDDDVHGGGHAGPVAVISYSFWKRHFGGDPNILGKTVRLDRHPFAIIGVTPPWFTGLDVDRGYDVYIPIGCEPILHTESSMLADRYAWWLRILGRLKPGEASQEAESA